MDELEEINEFYSSPEPPSTAVIRRQRERLMTMIEESNAPASGSIEDSGRPGRRSARRQTMLLAAPVAVIGLAAAGWAAFHSEPTQAQAFTCNSDASTVVISNDGRSPLEECKAIWASGTMGDGSTTPELIECISEHGMVAVIVEESADACTAAGMSDWTGQQEYQEVGASVREARIAMHDHFQATGDGCATEQDWQTELGSRLRGRGSGWTIESESTEPGRSCFALGSLDLSTETVTITGVGAEDDYSIGCDPRTGC